MTIESGISAMRPLDELPRETLAKLTGLVFDIDDTITRDGRLESVALAALEALAPHLHLVAVTGRSLGWAEAAAQLLPVNAAVGENGAGFVYRVDRVLRHGFHAEEPARQEHALRNVRIRERASVAVPRARLAADSTTRIIDLAFDVREAHHLDAEEIELLAQIIEEEGAEAVLSSVHLHAAPKGVDKASGVTRAVAECLGIDLVESQASWMFVGDSGNDASAFAFFANSVGVSNVLEHLASLPVPPRFVTRADRGKGFAELAARILAAKRGPGPP